MNLARLSPNGQITVPIEIRKQLDLKTGDKILFIENQNGDIVISNASAQAVRKAQSAFSGAAGEMNIKSEADVQSLVNELRYGERG